MVMIMIIWGWSVGARQFGRLLGQYVFVLVVSVLVAYPFFLFVFLLFALFVHIHVSCIWFRLDRVERL